MTTRTVKMFGLAYGATPAEIAVTLDGTTVYSGVVPTVDEPPLTGPSLDAANTTVEFCTFEIPVDFAGTKPMTCSVTNGRRVIFAQITANYCKNPGTVPEVGTGPDVYGYINGTEDVRSDIFIDGIEQTVDHEAYPGIWWFGLSAGSTLSYNLNILAGTEAVAP